MDKIPVQKIRILKERYMSSEDWRKILINFDYYHYKYKKKMECQEIIKFLGNDDK